MFGWNVLYVSVKSVLVITSVKSLISMLGFCLADLFLGEIGVLKSSTISVWSLMYDLSFMIFLLHMWVPYSWGINSWN